jgi:urease accessory protein
VKARAHLAVECDRAGATVVRELRCAPPITLVPARANGSALVHLVNSAAGPLGGDELNLTVHVGQNATLRLVGVAATIVLPGPHGAPSRSCVRFELADGARVVYRPEPMVVTARADHEADLVATLAGDARLSAREVVVLGRAGERPGALAARTSVTRDGLPVLRQHLRVGDPELDGSAAGLVGRRVLATELNLDGAAGDPASGQWWSRSPLARGGTLVTALADDTVTALRRLEEGCER